MTCEVFYPRKSHTTGEGKDLGSKFTCFRNDFAMGTLVYSKCPRYLAVVLMFCKCLPRFPIIEDHLHQDIFSP